METKKKTIRLLKDFKRQRDHHYAIYATEWLDYVLINDYSQRINHLANDMPRVTQFECNKFGVNKDITSSFIEAIEDIGYKFNHDLIQERLEKDNIDVNNIQQLIAWFSGEMEIAF